MLDDSRSSRMIPPKKQASFYFRKLPLRVGVAGVAGFPAAINGVRIPRCYYYWQGSWYIVTNDHTMNILHISDTIHSHIVLGVGQRDKTLFWQD